ncbi:ribonuclease HII [Bdellovibrionota bacterium FG-1]
MSPSEKKTISRKSVAARSGSKSKTRSPDLEWEQKLGYPHVWLIGVDEVGRGCLAGPVVAGALVLPPAVDFERDPWLKRVADSKCLTPAKRDELAPLLEKWAFSYGIGVASVEEVDRLNIYHASHLAMVRAAQIAVNQALERGGGVAFHAIIDGNRIPQGLPCAATAVVKGDLKCLSVAASSILAKVWRDRQMAKLDDQWPGYGFGIHKGYGTPAHQAALARLGPCLIHRRSFAPVARLIANGALCADLPSNELGSN